MWGKFEHWSSCSVTCGGGIQKQTRRVHRRPRYGGKPCRGPKTRTRPCNKTECTHRKPSPSNHNVIFISLALKLQLLYLTLSYTVICNHQTYFLISECISGNATYVKENVQKGVECIFPFTYGGITYNSCTYDYSRVFQYFPWCSTKVDTFGEHLAGKNSEGAWNVGICEDKDTCPLPNKRKSNL